MATIRLVPSTYSLSSTSYLSVANESNMYANTDNTSYATVTNSRTSTTSYYIYLKGFNFDDIPGDAVVNAFTVKLKAYESGVSTSSSYAPMLVNNTTTITSSCSAITTTAQTLTFTGVTADWDTIVGYGSNFGIRINCRRASRNTTGYVYIYGAEILVDYTIPTPYNITTVGNGCTVSPAGTTVVYEGDSFTVSIDAASKPTVTDNGVDVTDLLIEKAPTDTVTSTPSSYATSGSITGTYYQSTIGKDHNTADTTGNNYCSSSGSTAYISYSFELPDIPSGATITNVSCKVKGHCESTTSSSEKATVQLYAGTTAKGTSVDFTSTTDSIVDVDGGTWTRSELDSLTLRFTIGYYGGNVSGATLSVTYEVESSGTLYVYTITSVTVEHTIIATVSDDSDQLYIKDNGAWTTVVSVYKKVDGVWVLQDSLPGVFEIGTKYLKGN